MLLANLKVLKLRGAFEAAALFGPATETEMKRAVLYAVTIVGAALALPGCPIFPEDHGCFGNHDCAPGYVCDRASGACVASSSLPDGTCTQPSDCGINETCASDGICRIGDCTFVDCVAGYTCDINDGSWSCIPVPIDAGSGATGGAGVSYGGAGPAGGAAGMGSGFGGIGPGGAGPGGAGGASAAGAGGAIDPDGSAGMNSGGAGGAG
jgi:hypothetical protein